MESSSAVNLLSDFCSRSNPYIERAISKTIAVGVTALLIGGSAACRTSQSPPRQGWSPTGEQWLLLRVDAVEASPFKPATNEPWDGPVPQPSDGAECGLLGLLGGVMGGPIVGKGLEYFCQIEARPKQAEQSPTEPDLAVRIQAGGAVYSTYTARDSARHMFASEFVVPMGAIQNDGLSVTVVDKDGDAADVIGSVRIGRAQLAASLTSPDPVLHLASGALLKLDLVVLPLPARADGVSVVMNAREGTRRVNFRPISAGEVIEVYATGQYKIGSFNDAVIDPRGYPNGRVREYNFENEPFRSAAHGSGLAVLGWGDARKALVVAPCVRALAIAGGPLLVGVNDKEPGNNEGQVFFSIRARPPSADEWRNPWLPEQPCDAR